MDTELEQLTTAYETALQNCRDKAVAAKNTQRVEDLDFIRKHMKVGLTNDGFGFERLYYDRSDLPVLFEKPVKVTHFGFRGPEGQVAKYADTLDAICTHEIGHAIQFINYQKHGQFNTIAFKDKLAGVHQWLEKKPLLKFLQKPLNFISSIATRIEEFRCDKFMLQNLPDTDPGKLRSMSYNYREADKNSAAFLEERNKKMSGFDLKLEDIFNAESHPNAERRYRHLVAEQRKQQKKQLQIV